MFHTNAHFQILIVRPRSLLDNDAVINSAVRSVGGAKVKPTPLFFAMVFLPGGSTAVVASRKHRY